MTGTRPVGVSPLYAVDKLLQLPAELDRRVLDAPLCRQGDRRAHHDRDGPTSTQADRQAGGGDPLRPPHRYQHDARAGAAAQRHSARHHRAHRERPADARLREDADDLAADERPARLQEGARRCGPVDRHVAHGGHGRAGDRVVPDVVPGEEAHEAATRPSRQTHEDEVEEADMVADHNGGADPRDVFGSLHPDPQPQQSEQQARGRDGEPVHQIHAASIAIRPPGRGVFSPEPAGRTAAGWFSGWRGRAGRRQDRRELPATQRSRR